MAFVKKTDEEIDQNANPTTGGAPDSVITSGSAGGPPSAAAAAGSAAQGKPGTTGSGMFDNVGRYLDVNQEKAKDLANRVSGLVGNQINTADTAVKNAASQFNKDVDKATVKYNEGLVTDATKNAQNYAADQAKKASVQGQYNATYTGPKNLTDQDYYNTALSDVNQAKATAALAGNEAGRKELLARTSTGRPSGGILALNNAILQSNNDAQNIIANAAKGASSLDKRLADAAASAGIYAGQGETTTNATRDAARKAFANAYGDLQSQTANRATAAQTAAQKAANDALNAFNTQSKLTPAQLSLLGIGQSDEDAFRKQLSDYQAAVNAAKLRDTSFNADPNQFANLANLTDEKGAYGAVSNGAGLFNASNTATAEDYARLAALNALSGRTDNFLTNPKLAGTAPGDLLDYRFSDLQKRLSDAIAAANAVKDVEKDKAQLPGVAEGAIDTLIKNGPKTGIAPLDTLINLGQNLGGAVSDLSKNTQKTIEKAAIDTKEEAKRLVDNTKKQAGDYADKAKSFLEKPLEKTAEGILKAGGDTTTAVKKAVADTTSTAKKAAGDTTSAVKKAVGDTVTTAKKAVGDSVSTVKKAGADTSSTAKKAVADSKAAGAKVAEVAKKIATAPVQEIAKAIPQIPVTPPKVAAPVIPQITAEDILESLRYANPFAATKNYGSGGGFGPDTASILRSIANIPKPNTAPIANAVSNAGGEVSKAWKKLTGGL